MRFSKQIIAETPGFFLKFAFFSVTAGFLFFLYTSSGITGCAHKLPPPGGPADSLAPKVVAVHPQPGAVNQPTDLQVIFAFSEWMHSNLKRNHFFISPSLPRKLHIEHKGDRAMITSKAKLEDNTTYILTLLAGATDMKGNAMTDPFQLMFSTGPQIDTTIISGRIVQKNLRHETGKLFSALYPNGPGRDTLDYLTLRKWGEIEADSIPVPGRERPMYIIPADSNGQYSSLGIKPGKYSLLTFLDINQNFLPDVGIEQLGIGPSGFVLTDSVLINPLMPTQVDTLPVGLIQAQWRPDNQIDQPEQLEEQENENDSLQGLLHIVFSKDIKAESLKQGKAFTIIDKETDQYFSMEGFHPFPDSLSVYQLLSPKLETGKRYTLVVDSVIALDGKVMESDTITFTPDAENPLQGGRLLPVDPLDPKGFPQRGLKSDFFIRDQIDLRWSGILDSAAFDSLQQNLKVELDSTTIPSRVSLVNFRTLRIQFDSLPFNGASLYIQTMRKHKILPKDSVAMDSVVVDSLQNDTLSPDSLPLPDSIAGDTAVGDSMVAVPLFSVQLPDSTQFSTLELKNSPSVEGWIAELVNMDNSRTHRFTLQKGEQTLQRVTPGNYRLGIREDKNNDGYWNPGRLSPWVRQESRYFWPDTVKLSPKEPYRFPHELEWPPGE